MNDDASNPLSLAEAGAQAAEIRRLYHQLEERHHASPWSKQEDMVGFLYDIGELGRLLMAEEGRWVYPGDLKRDLPEKLAECLWWIFVLSDRLGVDITEAYRAKIADLQASLSTSIAKE